MKNTLKKITMKFEYSTILNSMNVPIADSVLPTWWTAEKILAKDFAKLFNYSDGTRVLNFFGGFRSLRQCLGDSFNWVFGFVASKEFKLKLGRSVADKIKDFIGGSSEDGVRILNRVYRDGYHQLEAIAPGRHTLTDLYDHSLIVPTGKRSRNPHFEGLPVFIRFDVQASEDERSLLNVRRVLLCTKEGESICGLASVDDYIKNIQYVASALKNLIGKFDVLAINARLFEAWAGNHDNTNQGEFCVDLGYSSASSDGSHPVAAWFERSSNGEWTMSLDVAGCRIPVSHLASCKSYRVDVSAVVKQVRLARQILTNMTAAQIEAAVAYHHCLCDHTDRFGDEFATLIHTNPTEATARFQREVVIAVDRFKIDSKAWFVALFHGGRERTLELAGEAIESHIQLLAPLYLTTADENNLTPTVYICVGLNVASDGTASIFFPSVLTASAAEADTRYFSKTWRHTVRFAEAV